MLLDDAAAGAVESGLLLRHLKTDELLFGKAVTVDDLDLFDQGALPALCRS